jgi:hypothetical protein
VTRAQVEPSASENSRGCAIDVIAYPLSRAARRQSNARLHPDS